MSWRTLSDADRQREYSPSSRVGGDISAFLRSYAQRSADARNACAAAGLAVDRLHYGPATRQIIDLVRPQAASPVPLLVFIHGGYWQELSPNESFFAATDAVDHGVALAAVGYTLAPEATLDDIVAEVRLAIAHLVDRADSFGIDKSRVVVSGSSAGAHLAAMVSLEPGWRPAAAVLVSGIYELEPLIGTDINEALSLDEDAARRNSPMFADLAGFPPATVVHGDNETDEFKRQSAEFAQRIAAAGGSAVVKEIADRNHFDVILDLCDPDEVLGAGVLDLLGASEPYERA